MKHRIGVVLLAASLIGGFMGIGAYFHELSGAASYDVTRWRGAAGQGGVSAQAGDRLFNGRASCMACHSIGDQGVGVRGPNLGVHLPDLTEPVTSRAASAQDGKSAAEHLVEALYDPDAFIVSGFEGGVMVPVNGPPSMLSDEEIRSILLYVYQQNGVPVTAALEEELAAAQLAFTAEDETAEPVEETRVEQEPVAPPQIASNAERGRALFAELRCGRCHSDRPDQAGGDARVSELADTADQPVALLLRIAEHTAEDPQSDQTFGDTLSVRGAADLAAYLIQVSHETPPATSEP